MEMEAAMQSCAGAAQLPTMIRSTSAADIYNCIQPYTLSLEPQKQKSKPYQYSSVPMPFLWPRIKFRLQLTQLEKKLPTVYV
jgi:hypothetical protein